MKRIRVGVCMMDSEFLDRFCGCLMNHYKDQLELHIFTEAAALAGSENELDIMLFSDLKDWKVVKTEKPVIYLYDGEEDICVSEEEGVHFVDKFQEVNQIVDQILQQVGEDVRNVRQSGVLKNRTRLLAVYGLSETEYQLPLAVTLASVLGEKEKTLLVDLQENSGLTELAGEHPEGGLEDILVMIEGGKCSPGRMLSGIGHLDGVDFVYPVTNSECLCETRADTYMQLTHMLGTEMGYETIVFNLGSRFEGFFKLLFACGEIYFLKERGGLGQLRQKEFLAELNRHQNGENIQNLREIEIPKMPVSAVSCERLVEQWKWNEFGDSIRRMLPEVMAHG